MKANLFCAECGRKFLATGKGVKKGSKFGICQVCERVQKKQTRRSLRDEFVLKIKKVEINILHQTSLENLQKQVDALPLTGDLLDSISLLAFFQSQIDSLYYLKSARKFVPLRKTLRIEEPKRKDK